MTTMGAVGIAKFVGGVLTISLSATVTVSAQQGTVSQENAAAVLTLSAGPVDFRSAKPLSLPIAPGYTPEKAREDLANALSATPPLAISPQPSRAGTGTGRKDEVNVGSSPPPQNGGGATPLAFGTSNRAFSTARADLDPLATNETYPYRAAGKLFFVKGGETYMCSASLIKRGVVVTAAHCVAEYGQKKYFSGWQFIPGYRNGVAPYGVWTVAQARVLDAYYQGTDKCSQKGVVCESDIAVLVLSPKKDNSGTPYYAGTNTGWYSYAWDKGGFTGQGITHLTQIGYPGCLDDGEIMQRNDSQGVVSADYANNTVFGSLMCGGSSGGPVIVNFGVRPKLTGTSPGLAAEPNQVVGVNSWGSKDDGVKHMGTSPFTATNIVKLVDGACAALPDACKD